MRPPTTLAGIGVDPGGLPLVICFHKWHTVVALISLTEGCILGQVWKPDGSLMLEDWGSAT